MAAVQVKELIAAGMHFGHRSSRWNPKMGPYIFGKRNLIHIIDLKETLKGLIRARRFLARVAARSDYVLFVGTKRQAREAVESEAKRAGCPFVAQRWLGGCLTNFRTVRSRLARLLELEHLEESGGIQASSKKMIASLRREKRKMLRNLDGIRTLDRLPGALVVVDPRHEHIAVREARKLNIPTIALLDTDSDPDLIALAVPGNDDSIRSIEIYLAQMAEAVLQGKAVRAAQSPEERERPKAPPVPGGAQERRAGMGARRPTRGRGRGPGGGRGRGRGPAAGGPRSPSGPGGAGGRASGPRPQARPARGGGAAPAAAPAPKRQDTPAGAPAPPTSAEQHQGGQQPEQPKKE